jgi:sugar phosphate isomerase/epimerase
VVVFAAIVVVQMSGANVLLHGFEFGFDPPAHVRVANVEAIVQVQMRLRPEQVQPLRRGELIRRIFEQHFDTALRREDPDFIQRRERGIEVLLENTPNELSSAERLNLFRSQTHLNLNYCFDIGHAHLGRGVEAEFGAMKEHSRSTHLHDNDGREDQHLFPGQGTIDWGRAMELLSSCGDQVPLLLELREVPNLEFPVREAKARADRLVEYSMEVEDE